MISMSRRTLLCLAVFLAGFGLAVSSLAANAQDSSKRGRKYKSPPPTARIEVTVLRDNSGKPIENAAVVFHPMEGEKDEGNMELKTNEDGKTIIDVLPIGDTIRVQVIAKGFQTFGQDYKVDKAQLAIEIRMKRPGEQYSIYKNHDQSADAAPKPDKPSDNAKPPPPSQPQPK
jgi:5-hydroxyisourate hydrolase-like protein (transthyretin family)